MNGQILATEVGIKVIIFEEQLQMMKLNFLETHSPGAF